MIWRDRPPRSDATNTGAPFQYYTLRDAMSLSPTDDAAWVYAPQTPKVDDVRVIERSQRLNILFACGIAAGADCRWIFEPV